MIENKHLGKIAILVGAGPRRRPAATTKGPVRSGLRRAGRPR